MYIRFINLFSGAQREVDVTALSFDLAILVCSGSSFLMFFILLGFLFLLRSQHYAAGISLGLAAATKWSGIYYLAAYIAFVLYAEYRQNRALEIEGPLKQTIREKLPEGFQRSEYLKDHGMVDTVVHRHDMKSTVSRLARMLTQTEAYVAPVGALVPA